MKKFSRLFATLLTALLCIAGCDGPTFTTHNGESATAKALVDDRLVAQAIERSAQYLSSACKPEGEFVYLDHLDPNVTEADRYNELRHAGTLYPMGEYYTHYKQDPKLKAAMVRAAKFFVKKYVGPMVDTNGRIIPDALGSWTVPADEGKNGNREVKLGGNGLGLVGLLQTEKVASGTTPMQTLRGLGNGIVFLQAADGRFYAKYDPKRGGKLDKWESLYYPGEAALGLVMLYELDPDPKQKSKWLNTAIKALEFLARSRKGATDLPADHWALIATAKLWPHLAGANFKRSRQLLMEHALQLCRWIVADPNLHSDRTTPVATRLEGLLAMMAIFPTSVTVLRTEIIRNANGEVARLIQCQVKDGKLVGAIPRSFNAIIPKNGESTIQPNGKVDRDGEVRIDYVQHAMSAMMSYDGQILSKKEAVD